MSDNKYGAADPLAFGRQLWTAWSDFAQQQIGKPPAAPSWHEGMQFWSKLAGNPSRDASHAIEQMSEHGQHLMQMLQTIAGRIAAGEAVRAGDLAGDWQQALGGGNPMFDTLRHIATEGARGWDQFTQGIEPVLEAMRSERNALLGLPAFGIGRERQEQMQQILQAQGDYAEKSAAYAALLAKASQHGLQRFERKLAERSEPGRQLDSLRALYDLWIDAAEEAYAEVAMSDEFRSTYGAMVNAQMRLKQLVQHELDRQVGALGLPTRAELDGAHRKIHAMQRELRELRELVAQRGGAAGAGRDERHREARTAGRDGAAAAATRKRATGRRSNAESAVKPAPKAPARKKPARTGKGN